MRPINRSCPLIGALQDGIVVLLVEHLMYKGNRDRALADGRRHALDIAAPDIADREHTGQTRFEEVGRAGEWPTRRSQILWG